MVSGAILTSAGVGLLAIAAFLAVTAFPAEGSTLAPIAVAIGTAVALAALLIGLRSATR